MTFLRTTRGLSNAALFYRADKVVYVEGGNQSNESTVSLDQAFWARVFSTFRPDLAVRVLSRGGKLELRSIAERVQSGEVSNVIVAMDRDLDPELGLTIDHPCVLYTNGYSWESDAWTNTTLVAVFRRFCLAHSPPPRILSDIEEAYRGFLVQAVRVARVNLAARLCCGKPVVKSDNYRALVHVSRHQLPSFSTDYFRRELSSFNRNKTKSVTLSGYVVSARHHVLGHLVGFFGYHLVCRAFAHLGQYVRVNYEFLCSAIINAFVETECLGESPTARHYSASLGRIS